MKRSPHIFCWCTCLIVAIAAVACPRLVAADPSSAQLQHQILKKSVLVAAPPETVWWHWTTIDGVTSFLAKGANIELRLGGPYEWYFDMSQPEGLRGGEGCTVLSYLPYQMIAFSWNAPPSIPALRNAGAKTMVVVSLDPKSEGRTKVTLSQHGFGEGEDWRAYYAYFDRAWQAVLDALKAKLDHAPAIAPGDERESVHSWQADRVRVTSVSGPFKRQQFEVEIQVPFQKVWHVLTTSQGLHSIGFKEAKVELRAGGAYHEWPGADNRVLAFLPQTMLSGTGSAPPKFPAVRKGGTWWVTEFESASESSTKLRTTLLGWRDGEQEWDQAFDYFLQANATYYNAVAKRIEALKK